MATRTRHTDIPLPKDADLAFRKKLAGVIKKSGMSYQELADRLGISVHLLHAYTSCKCEFGDPETKRKARCPAYLISKVCRVLENYELLDHLSPARWKKLLKLAEAELEARRHARELLRRKKARAKAKSKPKKGGRPFLVGTGTNR